MARILLLLCLGAFFWSGEAKASPTELTGVVNLNEATARELDALPGVGEKSALRIVLFRQRAPFRRVEDLMRVKGIGAKKFARMRPYLAVSGPSTLARTARRPGPPEG